MKILSVFLAAAILLSGAGAAVADTEPATPAAASAFLGEITTGDALYEYESSLRRNPETLTKIMTLLLACDALESGGLTRESRVTVSSSALTAVPKDAVRTGLAAGDKVRYIDLLYLAFLGGGADASNAAAEAVSGSVAAFVESMNVRADELGCVNTNFTTPHGEKSDEQYTTAADLFLIARAASESELFLEVAGKTEYTVTSGGETTKTKLTTANYAAVPTRSKYYDKRVVAGTAAKNTYASGSGCVEIAESGGLRIIAVILGSKEIIEESDSSATILSFVEARRLIGWGFGGYAWKNVLEKGMPFTEIPVRYGAGRDSVTACPDGDVIVLVRIGGAPDNVTTRVTVYSEADGLEAPVRLGDALGEITVLQNGREIAKVGLVAVASVDKEYVAYFKAQLRAATRTTLFKWIVFAVIALAAVYIAVVVRYNIQYNKRRREGKNGGRRG
ncbi:MAG: hypothetical protein LBS90_03525 [Oscillospiraceae bacterium]|jgi:D-alanyl-D-alanine carboxypeptidase (penicillin-binding protein 5/6)|nr:hypothetical protein [Oscillospiraceae bacterium]